MPVARSRAATLIATCFLSLAVLSGRASAAVMFPSDAHEGGFIPFGVATGDFDGDGITDIVGRAQGQSGLGPGEARIFLGNGDGSFRPVPPVSFAPNTTNNMLVGDLNGDGRSDLVIGLDNVSSLQVLLSNGDGTFTAAPSVGTGTGGPRGWLADYTGDGRLDLLVKYGSTTPTIEILPGRGDGTFGPSSTGPVTEPSIGGGFLGADVNGDGKMDLVTGLPSSGVGVRTFLGNGDGTLTYVSGLSVGSRTLSFAVDDFDRDGHPDLVVGSGGSAPHVKMYRGNGDGTFQPTPFWQVWQSSVFGLTSGDINRDGWPDLVLADNFQAGIFFGTGGGNVAQHEVLQAGQVVATALGEFDSQGGKDLAVAGFTSFSVSTFLSDVDGTFARLYHNPIPLPIAGSGGRTAALLADLNGDGVNDLAGVDCDGTGCSQVAVAPGIATGGFGTPAVFAAGNNVRSIAAADLNGDLNLDLVVTNAESGAPASGTVSVLIGTGNGSFLPQVKHPVGRGPDALAVGDLDEDGDLDIVVVNRADPEAGYTGDVSVLAGHGDGTFDPEFRLSSGRAPLDAVIADLNGDGHPDLATVQAGGYPTLPAELAWMPGNGSLVFPTRLVLAQGKWFDSLTAGDLDGDGDVDLITTDAGGMVVGNGDPGESKVFLNNGVGSFTASAPMVGGSWPLTGRLQDLNVDGIDDFVVFNNCCAGGSGDIAIFPGKGDGTFGTPERYHAYGFDPLALGPFDGDLRPDIILGGGTAILNVGLPAPQIQVATSGRVSWQGVPLCAGYDVVKGDLGLLHSSGLSSAILGCVHPGGLTQTVLDAQVPPVGHGFFYMARAIKQSGDPGTYDGEGPGQVAPRDSAIAASGLACP